MAKYEVIRPWHGVKRGDVVEIKKLHPALKANVRPLRGEAAELVPATPSAATPDKSMVTGRLRELGIDFNGRLGVDKLVELLPDGDPLKPATE